MCDNCCQLHQRRSEHACSYTLIQLKYPVRYLPCLPITEHEHDSNLHPLRQECSSRYTISQMKYLDGEWCLNHTETQKLFIYGAGSKWISLPYQWTTRSRNYSFLIQTTSQGDLCCVSFPDQMGKGIYAFPPFKLVGPTILKFHSSEGMQMILVAP